MAGAAAGRAHAGLPGKLCGMTSERVWRVRRTTETTVRAPTAMEAIERARQLDRGEVVNVEAVVLGYEPAETVPVVEMSRAAEPRSGHSAPPRG